MLRNLANKLLVPVLTLAIIAAAIWGLLKLTEKVGENLAPIKPRVLVFGASWCHYCPTDAALQKLQDDFPDVEVVHYDVDEHPDMKAKYHIKKLPTIIVCGEKGCKIFNSLAAVRAWLTNGSL